MSLENILALMALVASFITCHYARPLCSSLSLMDLPNARKLHAVPTPLAGGIVLALAGIPASLAFIFLSSDIDTWTITQIRYLTALLAMALLGIIDDRHALSPRSRLLFSFLIFILLATIDPTFRLRTLDFYYLDFQLGLVNVPIAVIFTAFCCVALINAVNMADGKNGLVIGMSIGWLCLLLLRTDPAISPLIKIIIAILIPLLIFNLRGKLFLGDGGAYGLATSIALLTIITYNMPGPFMRHKIAAEEIMALFFVPTFDAARLIITRMAQRKSPMAADRNHLHHILLDRFGWPGGLFIYWILAIVPAALLILYNSHNGS
ncbi:hypothetical protein DMP17_02940 [Pseudonocardia sp. TMWB2A]|uniref:glycosyltransferase family 4 protein n=1 Tax=Pseudonocardia sp. TMWB2A TaxID=687430 RepID=UPI00307FCEF1